MKAYFYRMLQLESPLAARHISTVLLLQTHIVLFGLCSTSAYTVHSQAVKDVGHNLQLVGQ